MMIVSSDNRLRVVAALIELAGGDDYRDRADAGRALATFADEAESRAALLGLVLDGRDTFVTRVTVEALLRRHDAAGLGVIAEALTSGADLPHQTQISDAVNAVFILLASQRDHAIDVCAGLALDTDEHLRHGAGQLRKMLMEVHSLLEPES
jgi:hypothetical protein